MSAGGGSPQHGGIHPLKQFLIETILSHRSVKSVHSDLNNFASHQWLRSRCDRRFGEHFHSHPGTHSVYAHSPRRMTADAMTADKKTANTLRSAIVCNRVPAPAPECPQSPAPAPECVRSSGTAPECVRSPATAPECLHTPAKPPGGVVRLTLPAAAFSGVASIMATIESRVTGPGRAPRKHISSAPQLETFEAHQIERFRLREVDRDVIRKRQNVTSDAHRRTVFGGSDCGQRLPIDLCDLLMQHGRSAAHSTRAQVHSVRPLLQRGFHEQRHHQNQVLFPYERVF